MAKKLPLQNILNINKVVIAGLIGNDIVIRKQSGENGIVYSRFSVGTKRHELNENGEQVESIEWHRCLVVGETLTDLLADRCQKGTNVYVEGENRTTFATIGNSDNKQPITEIIVHSLTPLKGEKVERINLTEVLMAGYEIDPKRHLTQEEIDNALDGDVPY